MKIEFTKMQGAGNDYIYVNTLIYPLSNPEELAVAWSRPHTGIGSDGLVLIGSSGKADFTTVRKPRCAATPAAASESMCTSTV